MARHTDYPFQLDWPVFVKIPFQCRGRMLEAGSVFKWQEMGMDWERINVLYTQGQLFHDPELAETLDQTSVGDGLYDLDVDSLNDIAKQINKKVKEKTKTETEFNKYKCKLSLVKEKQIGLIRSWRRNFGQKFE